MKKYFGLILLIVSAMIVTSCGGSSNAKEEEPRPPVEEQEKPSIEDAPVVEDNDSSTESDAKEEPDKPEKPEKEKKEIGIYPGMTAPELILNDRDNSEIKLADYAGKIVFLNFWATTCPYCVDEMPDLEAFYQAHKDDSDVALIGVNMTKTWERQSKEQLIEWLDEHGITFPTIFDEDGVEAERWAAHSLPITYIINTDGTSLGALMGRTDLDTLESVLSDVRASNQ